MKMQHGVITSLLYLAAAWHTIAIAVPSLVFSEETNDNIGLVEQLPAPLDDLPNLSKLADIRKRSPTTMRKSKREIGNGNNEPTDSSSGDEEEEEEEHDVDPELKRKVENLMVQLEEYFPRNQGLIGPDFDLTASGPQEPEEREKSIERAFAYHRTQLRQQIQREYSSLTPDELYLQDEVLKFVRENLRTESGQGSTQEMTSDELSEWFREAQRSGLWNSIWVVVYRQQTSSPVNARAIVNEIHEVPDQETLLAVITATSEIVWRT